MSYKIYRTEMLYIHFTWHRLIPERLFLPPRGPDSPGFAWMFCLLLRVLWLGLCMPRLRSVSCLRVTCLVVWSCGHGRTVSCSVFAWCIAVADSAWSCVWVVLCYCWVRIVSYRVVLVLVSLVVRCVHGLVVIILSY